MHVSWILMTSCGFAARLAASIPVQLREIPSSPKHPLIKRLESGPEIGDANFPDPCIIPFNGVWYSFATRTIGSSIHIQIAESSDFESWSTVTDSNGVQQDALPDLPPWVHAASPNTWAPDVNALDDGTFLMYFSASTAQYTSKHCVGAAFSDTILGPYTPQNEPLICPLDQGGAIDASGYNDDGQRYIVYKVDGNSIGRGGACGNEVPPYVSTPLVLQAVGPDGVTLQGSNTTLLDNDGQGDQGIIEGPSLVQSSGGGSYVLFFSSGCFNTGSYTVNYATSRSIRGPYTRSIRPLFQTGDYGLTAPGGADVHFDGEHLLFHADVGHGRALFEAVVTMTGIALTGGS